MLGKEDIELFNEGAISELMKTEFKKLAKIIENLRKVDGSITEDNILGKVEFDCDFTDIDKLKKIYDKV